MKRQQLHHHIPTSKKFTPRSLAIVDPLPVDSVQHSGPRCVGIFTGLSVEVCDPKSIVKLSLGGCGQGTKSRSFPEPVRNRGLNIIAPEMVHRRQLERRKEWSQKYGSSSSGESSVKVRVIEEDIEMQLECGSLGPRDMKYLLVHSEKDPFPLPENLSLCFEEAMFLVRELKCLEVRTFEGGILTAEQMVNKFGAIKKDFVPSYVSFIYCKAKNWIVKSGLKFGGDFLLYQKGPQFFHASYIVLVQPYQSNKKLPESAHYLENYDFQCFNRIAETTAKDLLILEVHYPENIDPSDCKSCFERLQEFKVSETYPKHHNYLASRMNQQNQTDCK